MASRPNKIPVVRNSIFNANSIFDKNYQMKTLPRASCELAPESLISLLLIININPKNNEM